MRHDDGIGWVWVGMVGLCYGWVRIGGHRNVLQNSGIEY